MPDANQPLTRLGPDAVEHRFRRALATFDATSARSSQGLRALPAEVALAMYRAQVASRQLDLAARRLRRQGEGYWPGYSTHC